MMEDKLKIMPLPTLSEFQEKAEKIALFEPTPTIEPQPEYPIGALGALLGGAARAIVEVVQVPPEIAAQSVLSVAALVAQSKANVSIDGRSSPVSLFCLSIAESGDRKSSCDKIAMMPINKWMSEQMRAYKLKIKDMEKADKSDEGISGDAPIYPALICREPTFEGLQKGFVDGLPFQGIFSDEGAQFFGGYAMNRDNCMKSIGGLSTIWDGGGTDRNRAAKGDQCFLENRRLSIHLMVQPIIAEKVLSDPLLQQQGILARFLVGNARSIAGTRLYKGVNWTKKPEIYAFHEAIAAILQSGFKSDEIGGLILEELEPNEEAKRLWIEYYNQIEVETGSGGYLESVKPTASKSAENVLRIAGVLSVINGEKTIQPATMAGAIKLGAYYLRQALRASQFAEASAGDRKAVRFIEWANKQGGKVEINVIQTKSPSSLGLRRLSVANIRETLAGYVEKGWFSVCCTNSNNQPSEWELVNVSTKG